MASLKDGRKTVTTAGTAVQLGASEPVEEVAVTALSTNTGVVCVGGSTVVAATGTRRGTPLLANDSFTVEVDDVGDVYLDATVSGEGVSFAYRAEA